MKQLFIFFCFLSFVSCGGSDSEGEEVKDNFVPERTSGHPPSVAPESSQEESPEFVFHLVRKNQKLLLSCVPHTMRISIDWIVGENGYAKEVAVLGNSLNENVKRCITEKIKTIFFGFSVIGKKFTGKYTVIVGETKEA